MRSGLILVCLIAAGATRPAGTMNTADPFDRNGVRFGAAGVSSWPIFGRDRIKTETSAAAIYLPDLGTLFLDRSTEVRFDLTATPPLATLVGGQIGFSLLANSRLRIVAGDRDLGIQESPGRVSRAGAKVQFVKGSATIRGVAIEVPAGLPSAGQ